MLQIYGKKVSFVIYILFYLLCQDTLVKLASIFVTVFQFGPAYGSMAEWFRTLVLQSGGPGFKASTQSLADLFLGSPEFKSSVTVYK